MKKILLYIVCLIVSLTLLFNSHANIFLTPVDGPWELIQEAQSIGWGHQIPAIYKAPIDGHECLVLVGSLADSLECK